MLRILGAIILCIGISFTPLAQAAQLDIPLPSDAVKTTEKSFNVGPSTSTICSYETALSQDKINAFYKKEMLKLGWREQSKGFFLKEKYLAVIAVDPAKNKNKMTQFSITTSSIPSQEEILAQRKAQPDKLSFMPVYPASEQVFLWDMPTGISASYETKSVIKDIVFFYKSGMLNYGWSLSDEAPLTTEAVDCPECQKGLAKLSPEAAAPALTSTTSRASLTFRKGNGESCIIRLYQAEKTMILVTYNANKKINP